MDDFSTFYDGFPSPPHRRARSLDTLGQRPLPAPASRTVRIALWKIVERSVFPPHRFFHAQEFRAKLPVSDGCVDGQDRNCDGDRSEGTDHHNEWDRHHGSVGPATSEESLDSDGATGKQHRIGGGEMVDLATEEQ